MLWSFTHQSGQKENVYQARNFCPSPFFLFRFSYPGSQVFCFYPGNLIYSCLPLLPVATVPPLFFFPPELLKSTEFAASSPSSFLLQSDLQTIATSVVHKTFFLVFIILRISLNTLNYYSNSSIYFCLQVFYSMVYFKGDRYITIQCVQIFFLRKCYPIFQNERL